MILKEAAWYTGKLTVDCRFMVLAASALRHTLCSECPQLIPFNSTCIQFATTTYIKLQVYRDGTDYFTI